MSEVELTVAGMTCDGCERSVKTAITRLEGVLGVSADHLTGAVKVTTSSPISAETVKTAIEDAGYEVVPAGN